MIASLRGKLMFRGLNNVVIDVQGVGYNVGVSLATLGALPDDGEVFLHVHTAVRETALELYGFFDEEEKALFEMLLGVAGVGPKIAITILSGIAPESFRQAVLQADIHRLTCIPGIGKKSAERIVLELKEKIKKLGGGNASRAVEGAQTALEDDLISSLVNLGYKERIASAAARKSLNECAPGVSLEHALKNALKELMK